MFKIHFSLELLEKILKEARPSKIVLVSSSDLISKLGWAILELEKAGSTKIEIIQIPDGEAAKEWDILKKLLSDFVVAKIDRKSLIIGFGGGSVTDLVGFASSIYQRGVNYINIPTTLLAQVDSSIGGKTGINFLEYKNQVGTFHNPIATIVDTRFLKTLNDEQIIDGLAEIIKAGLIKDTSILEIVKSHGMDILKKESIINELVLKSIKVKEYFVEKDPNDLNIRQILNFGHTIGHALELKYKISHGESVLIGMLEELKLSEKLGETKIEVRNSLNELFKGLNISLNKKQLEVDWEPILHDKKILGKEIVLPVVKELGKTKLIKIKPDKLKNIYNS